MAPQQSSLSNGAAQPCVQNGSPEPHCLPSPRHNPRSVARRILEPERSSLRTSNDQVERPSAAAICEALYRSRPLQPIVRLSSEQSHEHLTERVLRSVTEATDRVDQRPLFLEDHDAASAPRRHVAATDCDIYQSSSGRALPCNRCWAMGDAAAVTFCGERSRPAARSERGPQTAPRRVLRGTTSDPQHDVLLNLAARVLGHLTMSLSGRAARRHMRGTLSSTAAPSDS